MSCEWMTMNYIKRYCGQTVEVNEDVADRNQDGLTGWRKTQGKWVAEIGGRMSRIEVADDICLRRPRTTQGCTAGDAEGSLPHSQVPASGVPRNFFRGKGGFNKFS